MFYRESLSASELERFESELERMFHMLLPRDRSRRGNVWRPPTDLYETEESVIVQIEIAGMNPDDIEIQFSDRMLTVRGERKDSYAKQVYHCMEIPYGEFVSEVWLPGTYREEKIEAKYENGFLYITLPKVKTSTIAIPVKK